MSLVKDLGKPVISMWKSDLEAGSAEVVAARARIKVERVVAKNIFALCEGERVVLLIF